MYLYWFFCCCMPLTKQTWVLLIAALMLHGRQHLQCMCTSQSFATSMLPTCEGWTGKLQPWKTASSSCALKWVLAYCTGQCNCHFIYLLCFIDTTSAYINFFLVKTKICVLNFHSIWFIFTRYKNWRSLAEQIKGSATSMGTSPLVQINL